MQRPEVTRRATLGATRLTDGVYTVRRVTNAFFAIVYRSNNKRNERKPYCGSGAAQLTSLRARATNRRLGRRVHNNKSVELQCPLQLGTLPPLRNQSIVFGLLLFVYIRLDTEGKTSGSWWCDRKSTVFFLYFVSFSTSDFGMQYLPIFVRGCSVMEVTAACCG